MTDSSGIEFERVRTREQLQAFHDCAAIAFQSPMPDQEQWFDEAVQHVDVHDYRAALDGDRTVGTFLSFDQDLTAVGGATVPARAVSAVTVLPTHRRRGILGTHMRGCLDDARAAGHAAATLIAAEYGIYGRYGFGQSTEVVDYRIAVDRARLPERTTDELQYVGGEEYLAAGDRLRDDLTVAGRVSRLELSARHAAGLIGKDDKQRLVLRRDGEVAGVLSYTVASKWTDSRPDSTVTVSELLGIDAAAERELWAFAMSIDWVSTVVAPQRAPDDIVSTVPVDPRTVQVSNRCDMLWIRPLDVPALFAARTYAAPGRLVLDVTDPGYDGAGPGPADGRFLIDSAGAAGGAATCTPTDEPADLALDVTDLGRLWLSDEPVARRVAVGSVREVTDGAAARADLMLFSPRRPWSVEHF